MVEQIKTRYYRHDDPRRGFKICQQLQLASNDRMLFSSDIEQINKIYRSCSTKHTQCFLKQPNENQILQKFVILLTTPLLVNLLLQSFQFLVESYIVSIICIVYYVNQYMKGINTCRRDFDEANHILCEQFCEIQRNFQQKWPNYTLTLMRQWNQFNQTCVQFIEIYRKQQAIKRLPTNENSEEQLYQIKQNPCKQQ